VKLTIHLHLVPKSRMVEIYLLSPIHLHGLMLNYLSTGTNSLFASHLSLKLQIITGGDCEKFCLLECDVM
jgi:hypothetical protein